MPKKPTPQEYLTLNEVLTETRLSRSAFYRMRAKGQAPELVPLPNGHLRCSRATLDAWWTARRAAAA
ncbi:helix-turn-helix transcriptional regulator [Kitasatospora sp. NBC_01302]|uniref:helix-turn-helix transcriptional regulator n=1 Tax=Kitasatospora sp. NBC_01302 TaxID=2903575 RepID=UPI002E0F43CA|nr:helix-turn-helix domain-containing protein [Kitasatospora sp. NBC_01302]